MKCRSVRSECQEHSQKCAPRCRRALIQILPAFSPQHGCFFFTNSERDAPYRLLKASEKLQQSEPGSELVCVLVWQVTDESQGCGEGIVPAAGGGGFSWELSADTPSSHIHTCTPLQTQTDLSTLLLAFVSARVRFWTSSVWVVWRCI